MGLGDIKKLKELDRGMTIAQVLAILGEPKQKELKADKTVYKFELHEWMAGYKPVYVVFDDQGRLVESMVDEDEYQKRQELWVKALTQVNKNIT